jgi:RNA-directed DNA polymerase
MEAYKLVRANRGSAGVDDQSIEDFEKDLKNNLYKIWNRMSSGTYYPPAVKQAEIPKAAGEVRKLGTPTVADRIAQMVVKKYLEPKIEPIFHESSFGYRPNKSPLQAITQARAMCFRYPWVVEFDIKGLFDNIDHKLLMKAVRKHTSEKWIILYIERWLKAPFQTPEGKVIGRGAGTPQGGVISPLLVNLFLHYGFDEWIARSYPHLKFERFADDGIIHCRSLGEAKHVMASLGKRLRECKLEIHPEKSRIIYCKDGKRKADYPETKFTFLGYEFRRRICKPKSGAIFVGFTPAVSPKARKQLMDKIRKLKLPIRTEQSLADLQRILNPIMRGWVNYFGAYTKSALRPTLRHVNLVIINWALRKFKHFNRSTLKARQWLKRLYLRNRQLFSYWDTAFQM